MKNNILIIGGNGFVGSGLADTLTKKGYKVTIFDRCTEPHPLLKGVDYKFVKGDILDHKSLMAGMKKMDYVINLVACMSYRSKDRDLNYTINLTGAKNVLKAAYESNIKRMVHVSTTSSIGHLRKKVVFDETHPLDEHKFHNAHYMMSKNEAEEEVRKYAKKGLGVVIVNPATVIGAGDVAVHSGIMVKYVYHGVLMAPPGGLSIVSRQDVIEGMIKALEKGKPGERYILSTGNITFKEVFNMISDELGKKPVRLVMPMWIYPAIHAIAVINEKIFPNSKFGWVGADLLFSYRYYTGSKAKKDLGWTPKQTIRQAFQDAIQFYKKHDLL
ncbi:NAD-dependent epimerase/dehydratase family protein [Nanoarchaeota archaeon]